MHNGAISESMRHIRFFLFFFILFLCYHESFSSHIRAGEVIARRIGISLTYEFTFYGYRDQEGVLFGQGYFDFGDGEIYGDDDDEPIIWSRVIDLGNGVERWEFTLVHTYEAANSYRVSYAEDFRNADILNIMGSAHTSFFVETLIVIDPLIGINNTPRFTVPPIDQGVVGFRFEHNPGAFDPDGDSLSYFFTVPLKEDGVFVDGYRELIDPSFYDDVSMGSQSNEAATLTLDPVTGTIVWDAPGGSQIPPLENREYNVAFVVEEWRKINDNWIRLGYVTRDMQIIIWNFENNPPELEVPEDTCVIAGSTITASIIGIDPEGDPVKLEAYGGPFEVNAPTATYSPNPPVFQKLPASLSFKWQTVCGHVRQRPYEVQFKASDDPVITIQLGGITITPPGTVNFETWRITVTGPPPTGLTAKTQPGRSIQLNWDPYSCPNADSMQVWRRVNKFEIDPGCDQGISENAGYTLIKTLNINQKNLLDDNEGIGLSPGSKYCYRLVATFPLPNGGMSVVSEEICDSLLIDVPVITHVDTRATGDADGELLVRWTPPLEIESSIPLSDYTYSVLRTQGTDPRGDFTQISIKQSDTFLIDRGLNTKDYFYAYKIMLHDDTGEPVDVSSVASSVRLDPTSQIGAIQLNWMGYTPWSLSVQDFPYHYIYRDNALKNFPDSLVLIDSVDVTAKGFYYTDNGSFNGSVLDEKIEYCYYIVTQGAYGHKKIAEPLINRTQMVCLQPSDSVPPCTPVAIAFDASPDFNCELNSLERGCDFNNFQNRLTWEEDGDSACDDDIRRYRIYFSPSGQEGSFLLLAETPNTSFIHQNISSYAGCYQVASIDRSGNESQRSEVFCNDNCPGFLLPNVFTPNGDGVNDLFRPFYSGDRIGKKVEGFSNSNCPRFVRSVIFKVFNRAGTPLFEYHSSENENNILINWDGTTSGGKALPSGIYYYSAEVRFIRLNPEDEKAFYKGWIQLLR